MKTMRQLGPTYNAQIDGQRIGKQHLEIRDWMLNRGWRTLREISDVLGYPEASVSAQLRHAKKPIFGGYCLEKRRRISRDGIPTGTWEYRLLPPFPITGQMVFA